MKTTGGRMDPTADLAMIDRLRDGGFDAAVIFTVCSQTPLPAAMACYLAGIPLRLAHCRENAYPLLTDRIAEPEPAEITRHGTRRQLDLVSAVGATTADERHSLRVPEEARSRVAALLDRLGIDVGNPWAVVHPGDTAASHRYAPEGFASAAGTLARDHGFRIVFTGDRAEIPLVAWIREGMGVPSHSLAGKSVLAELAALIERAPVLISNNTGPALVAAAVGTPVVDLYALTNPKHTPWAVPSRVLNRPVPCAPCYKSACPEGHHDCLHLVDPAEIVRAALELVAEARPSRLASIPAAMPSRRHPQESPMDTLGINAADHDPAACLVRDGRLVAAAE